MRDINTPGDILTLCKALSSPVRLQILKLIADRKQINLNELAEALEITNGAITQHMKPLLDADLVDFMHLVTVPIVLGSGVDVPRWFDKPGVVAPDYYASKLRK